METEWYYTLDGQQKGPVPESELRSLIQGGQVASSEFVFKEGMTDWAVASSIPELAGVSAVAVPSTASGDVSFGGVYKEALEIFKEQWLQLCLGILVIIGPNIVLGVIGKQMPERWVALLDFAGLIITSPLLLGGWILFLNAVDRREVSVNQVWDGFQHFVPALIVGLIRHSPLLPGWVMLIILPPLGLLLSLLGILPFFACLYFLAFAYGFLADRNCSPIDAVKLSFNCVKDNALLVLVLAVMIIPLLIAGFIAAFVGMIPAGAFWLLTLAVAYRWLNPRTPA